RKGRVLPDVIAAREDQPARPQGSQQCRSACDQLAAKGLGLHGLVPSRFSGGTTNQPVIMERNSLNTPESSTSTTWMKMKSTIRVAAIKWIVRADCRPPKISRSQGAAESTPGDIVRPVKSMSGSRTKTTIR